MKLCFVASGVSIHTKKWLDWFASYRHEVYLISPPGKFQEFHPSVKVYPLKNYISPKHHGLWNLPLWALQARKIIREVKPDLVEGQYIGIPGAIAALAGYHPLVMQAWGSDILLNTKHRLNRQLVLYCLRRADMVLCDSSTVRDGIAKLTKVKRLERMQNGVDTQLFKPNRCSHREWVTSTRSLEPVYNVATTLKAFGFVLERFPHAMLMVAGDGSQRGVLQELAHTLRIEGNVTFLGQMPQDDIAGLLQISAVYVSSSVSDSASLCLQEAMASSLPCVVSNLPANREWISNSSLFPAGDTKAMANCICRYLRDASLCELEGKANRLEIVSRADYNTEMQKVENLYQSLI